MDGNAAPRIVQVLDATAHDAVVNLCRLDPGQVVIALDDLGRFWSYGPARIGEITREWHHLPLPPLPPLPDDGGER